MSDQGPVFDGEADFGLIETLLWTREAGFDLLPEHLVRLAASSAALGFGYDEGKAKAALQGVVAQPAAARLRVRLTLARDGSIETGATQIEPLPPTTVWRVAFARRSFNSRDPLLRYKTTRRALYEEELAAAAKSCGADEVLFLNERGELCEGARCNLFVPQGGTLLTPPIACGLLPGTLRASLVAQGRAREELLRPEAVEAGFFLGNSVRGLVRATLIG